MTLPELLELCHVQKLDVPYNAVPGPRAHFPMHETDVLVSEDGELVVALNRKTGRFAAQRGEFCMLGHRDVPLDAEQVSQLTAPSTENFGY